MEGPLHSGPFFIAVRFDNAPNNRISALAAGQRNMASAPTLQILVDDALVLLPTLTRRFVDDVAAALRQRMQHHHLHEIWQRQGLRVQQNLLQQLPTLIQAATSGADPLQASGARGLSLVDEAQALKDVAIAHAIRAVEERSGAELLQLGNFFAALRGTARARKNDNPLRPALFAQAFYEAMEQQLSLDAQGRYALLQAAAPALAEALHQLYAQLCTELRRAELSQLVVSHGRPQSEDLLRHRQAVDASLHGALTPTAPASLDQLSERLDLLSSRPQLLGGRGPALLGPASLAPGTDLLARLYDQILADPYLLPPVKSRLARLQVAVARLAHVDLGLLRQQDHPTWRLLNQVAAHGMGFERPDDAHLQQFLVFLDELIEPLLSQAQPTAAMFEQVHKALQDFIASQARQRGEASSTALARLERQQQRGAWQRVLREQIDAQLREARATVQTSPMLRAFLRGVWVEVIVDAMVEHGRESPEALAAIELVDELLESLHVPASEAERAGLRQALPGLVQRIEQGMERVQLAAEKRQAMLDDLIQLHGRLLLGQPAQVTRPERPATPMRPAATPVAAPASTPTAMQPLLDERESRLASEFFHAHVDRATLPTVPLPLEADAAQTQVVLDDWMAQLQIGAWYHLFVQSEWITAQITAISDSRQLFLFVGQDAQQHHPLTRGAVERLFVNGLITQLEEQTLVQRAIEQLMQNLDRDPG